MTVYLIIHRQTYHVLDSFRDKDMALQQLEKMGHQDHVLSECEVATPQHLTAPGTFGWFDLTISHCDEVVEFYQAVAGWNATAVSMGDYNDFTVGPPSISGPVAGLCHKRGPNAAVPSVWIPYINVQNLPQSLVDVQRLGGVVIEERLPDDYGQIAIIQDPAGATCALFQAASANDH